jgi:ribonuclease HII
LKNLLDILVCGVDEVGRGSAVGDIFAAACVLPHDHGLAVKDSKKLSIRQREILAVQIRAVAVSWAVGRVSLAEIEQFNVHKASLLAMERAVSGLPTPPQQIVVDGKYLLNTTIPCACVVGADCTVPAVSAASIIAKVARDAYMDELHCSYPDYGFDTNRGYLTPQHLAALKLWGPCPLHRTQYGPVRAVMNDQDSEATPNLFSGL